MNAPNQVQTQPQLQQSQVQAQAAPAPIFTLGPGGNDNVLD